MMHDAHEAVLGDPPFGMKAADIELAVDYEFAADRINEKYDWATSDRHTETVKFLDRLDAYLFVKLHAPQELTKPDWIKAREWLVTMSLGFSRDVEAML